MIRFATIFFLAALLTINTARGDEVDDMGDYEDVGPVEEIEVTGQSVPEPESAHVSGSVTVIDTSDSTERVTDVSEALEESAGLTVKRYGSLGGYSVVMIRGAGSNQTTVFLDGVPLSGAAMGTVNLANLPMDALDRIEVYRGVAPVGFGGAPIGGAVNLVTRSAGEGVWAGAAMSYGSFDTYKLDLFASSSSEDRNLLFFYNHLESAGDFEYLDDNGTPHNKDDDKTVKRKNNDFASDDILLKTGWKISDGIELFVANEYFNKSAGLPGFSTLRIGEATFGTMRNYSYVGAKYLGSKAEVRGLVYHTYIEERFHDPDGEIGIGYQNNLYTTRNVGGNATGRIFFGAFAMASLFGELRRETYEERDLLADETYPESKRLTYSTAAQGEIYLLDARLILVPTIRVEHYSSEFASKSSATYGAAIEDTKDTETLYSPHFGLRVNPWKPLTFTANVGRYYRVPSFVELFGDRGTTIGNPDLDPENGVHADGGVQLTYEKLSWFDRIRVAYTVYYLAVEDIIVFVQNSQFTARAENVARAEILGHELVLDFTMLEAVKFHANYTFQESVDRSGISYIDGNPLPGRPRNELHLGAALYRKGMGEVFYSFDYIDGNYLDRAGMLEVPSRKIHGAGVTVTPVKGLGVTFEVKNLTDDQVHDVLGYPLPGRSYFGTVKYEFSEK